MKLTQIKIIHFGKLNDVTFNLNKDLTIFLGANEAGKSTTVAFVKQVLFGFHLRTNNPLSLRLINLWFMVVQWGEA